MSTNHGVKQSVISYTTGFILSLLLTVTAYLFVEREVFMDSTTFLVIAGLAVVQLIVQMVCFLHLGQESKPRWNLMAFLFMLGVLFLVVFGSIWIMNNLNYHMMSPEQTDTLLRKESNKGF